ncbi:MAG: hypothetical protein H6833_11410 [Planctomycetes bacterium]|nr:hypothetical protein [Planctomycetota bacterium]
MPLPELLTRATIWCAILAYTLSTIAWRAGHDERSRRLWTAGATTYLLHAVLAFATFYEGSHTVAWRETARRTKDLTGFDSGAGLLLNELLLVVWWLDLVTWFRSGHIARRARPRWKSTALHAVFLFLIMNGGIVFAQGPVQWFTLACVLALSYSFRRLPPHPRQSP